MIIYSITSARMEECYIEDWVKHYLNLGIDKIIINDNNDKDYPYQLKDILKTYINSGQVIIERYYDTHKLYAQNGNSEAELNIIYAWLYNKYKNEFDWCLRFDIDEYLEISETNNDIRKFLLQDKFKDKLMIAIYWRVFNIKPKYKLFYQKTNNIKDRFIAKEEKIKGEKTYKCIIKSIKDYYVQFDHHKPWIKDFKINTCNPLGKPIVKEEVISNISYYYEIINVACINHYRNKSIEETLIQCNQKMLFCTENVYKKYNKLLCDYPQLTANLINNKKDLYKTYFINNEKYMKIYIITSARMEECYIKEWIDYHLNLGIDKIIINDNNDKDYPYQLKDILKTYIDNEQVIIERYYDTHKLEKKTSERELARIYTWLYNKYKNEFDWCLKNDIDEYLEIPETNNDIRKFLLQDKFKNAKCINIYWKKYKIKPEYSLYYSSDSIFDRFTSKEINTNEITCGCKCFIKSLAEEVHFNHHVAIIDDFYDACGNKINSVHMNTFTIDEYNKLINICHLKHFRLKSAEEELYKYKYKMQFGIDSHIYMYDKYLTQYPELKNFNRDLYKIYLMNHETS